MWHEPYELIDSNTFSKKGSILHIWKDSLKCIHKRVGYVKKGLLLARESSLQNSDNSLHLRLALLNSYHICYFNQARRNWKGGLEGGGCSYSPPPKVDLLPIDNDSEKKKVAKKYILYPLPIMHKTNFDWHCIFFNASFLSFTVIITTSKDNLS